MENEEAVKLSYSHVEAHDYPNMHGNARWDAVSGRAQSLVLQLMERDPDKRLTAQQVCTLPRRPCMGDPRRRPPDPTAPCSLLGFAGFSREVCVAVLRAVNNGGLRCSR